MSQITMSSTYESKVHMSQIDSSTSESNYMSQITMSSTYESNYYE